VLARAVGAAGAELDLRVDDTSARLRIRIEGAAPGQLPGAPDEIADRVAALAGTLATAAEPGATTVTVTLPLADGSP
jgi:signal transduction histidine kinase